MASPRDDFMDRTDADDLPRGAGHLWHHSTPFKLAHCLTGTEELASQVDAEHGVPLLEGHLLKGRIALQSGIVDQYVDGAKLVEHALKYRLDLILPGDVGFVGIRPHVMLLDLLHAPLRGLVAGDIVDDDIRPGAPQRQGYVEANTGVGTGYQGFL